MEPCLGGGINVSHPQSQEKPMKNCMRNLFVALALLALSILNPQLSTAFAQGSLTPPPGAPAPTMITLQQIEPRTPISSVPFTITTPGSYYLTTNLYSPSGNGITVSANDVTIDLYGFALVGNGVGSGIVTPANVINLFVRNGTVRNWGASSLGTSNANNSRFEKLRLSDSTAGLMTGYNCEIVDCTCWNAGNSSNPALRVSDGCVVRNCVVAGSEYGILGANGDRIESCLLRSNTFAIQVGGNCTIRDCTASAGGGTGINAGDNATVQGCQSLGSRGGGIAVGNGALVQDCVANSSVSNGFSGGSSVVFRHCTALNNGNAGFNANLSANFDGCLSISNAGVGISGSDNSTVTGCSSQINSDNGIFVGYNSRVQDCLAVGNTNAGIYVYGHTIVSGCTCDYNGLSGIYVFYPGCAVINNTCDNNNTRNSSFDSGIYIDDSNNRVDGNHVAYNNGFGIYVVDSYVNDVVIRNDAEDNLPFNYYLPSSTDAGPLGLASQATSPWANISY